MRFRIRSGKIQAMIDYLLNLNKIDALTATMKNVHIVAALYLVALPFVAIFSDFKKRRLFLKVILIVIAVLSASYSYFYQTLESRIEKARQRYSEIQQQQHLQNINKKLEKYNEKEGRGALAYQDYLPTICLYLDKLNVNISLLRKKMAKERYFTIYFIEVEKIPDFYSWEEWEETENILFKCLLEEIEGYFSREHIRKAKIKEFMEEREKYIKAKKRVYSNDKTIKRYNPANLGR